MTSRGVLLMIKKPFIWKVLDSGSSELRVVMAQFAHDFSDRGEFGVCISEDNWEGIRIVEIGRFWEGWRSRRAG